MEWYQKHLKQKAYQAYEKAKEQNVKAANQVL